MLVRKEKPETTEIVSSLIYKQKEPVLLYHELFLNITGVLVLVDFTK